MVDQPDTRRADADAGPDEGGARVRVVRFEEQFGELLADDPQQAAEVVARCLVAATRRHLQLLPPATTGGGSGPRLEVVAAWGSGPELGQAAELSVLMGTRRTIDDDTRRILRCLRHARRLVNFAGVRVQRLKRAHPEDQDLGQAVLALQQGHGQLWEAGRLVVPADQILGFTRESADA